MQRDNLDLLRALEEDELAGRRRALWTSTAVVVVAAAILGVLLFTAYRELSSVRAQTEAETHRLVALRRQNDSLQLLASNYQGVEAQWVSRRLDSVQTVRDSLEGLPSNGVAAQDTTRTDLVVLQTYPHPAADTSGSVTPPPPQTQRADPAARVYLQVLAEADRAHAERVGQQLQARGFRVLGVEYVQRSARLRNTELRYYKRADAPDAQRLLAALREIGEDSTALLYLGLENNTRVRPRHYEVWFAPGAGRAARPQRAP